MNTIIIRLTFINLCFFSTLVFSKDGMGSYFGFDISVCSINEIENRTESEVEKCMDYLETEGWLNYKEYTLKALELNFSYPAIVINHNENFKIQKSKKLAALYKVAFSCYEPAYSMVLRIELDNKTKDALLWALLIYQNSEKYEGLEPHRGVTKRVAEFAKNENIHSFQLEELLLFFDRFDCTARRK